MVAHVGYSGGWMIERSDNAVWSLYRAQGDMEHEFLC
jgi:hypothetical protein